MENDAAERDLVVFHVAFLAVCVAVLLLPGPLGWQVAALVLLYDVGLLALAHVRQVRSLLRLWWFAAVLSVWQVLPDVFLVEGLRTLVFPPDGFPDIGPVTATMAGLWTIPMVVVVATALAVGRRRGRGARAAAAVAVGALVFVPAEAVLPELGIWEARGVTTLGNVALYIIPAEIALCVAATEAFAATRARPWWAAVPTTLFVSVFYTGAAALSWVLIEGWAPRS